MIPIRLEAPPEGSVLVLDRGFATALPVWYRSDSPKFHLIVCDVMALATLVPGKRGAGKVVVALHRVPRALALPSYRCEVHRQPGARYPGSSWIVCGPARWTVAVTDAHRTKAWRLIKKAEKELPRFASIEAAYNYRSACMTPPAGVTT